MSGDKVKVKICGITNISDAETAIKKGADYVGIVLTPKSRRCVQIKTAREIVRAVPDYSNFVGVFLNQSFDEIISAASDIGLNFLQLHGEESEELTDKLSRKGYQIIKAFHIKDESGLNPIKNYETYAVLLDSYDRNDYGGTGNKFDWTILNRVQFKLPRMFLAGGLTPENVRDAVLTVRPFAVDVSSGVEAKIGIKDPSKIASFIKNAKEIN